MKFLTTCLLLLACTVAHAQQTVNDRIFDKHHQLKLSVMAQLDPVNPGWDLSYEFQYAKRWASQVNYTWLTDHILAYATNRGEPPYISLEGRRIGIEQKFFYPEKRSVRVREYFGLNLNYLETRTVSKPDLKSKLEPGVFIPPAGTRSTDRYVFSTNFKFGFEIPLWRGFLLDMSGGPGIKYREVTNTYSNPDITEALVEWDILNRYNPTKEWTGTFTFDIKIGYMF
ncbi:hypothetical protein ACFOTA_11375 [Chitinophaga sp. GCM10012297]|uniref:DUF2490 domain-containing protein n=1 Tax=Chitinophaga chungangae TaxID=2821488 RepID=A0ABS3YDQ8_9BACT|nr:hypothetical protein [Chitinophaga chungangae]MBO9152810.1 hypothetical protein [Chitinophaga chungangae]